MNLNQVTLPVTDFERSVTFYRDMGFYAYCSFATALRSFRVSGWRRDFFAAHG